MADKTTATFSLEDHTVILDRYIFDGFENGDAVATTVTDDDWEYVQGTSGKVERIEKPNNMGDLTIRLLQTNPLNARFEDLRARDKEFKEGPYNLNIKDNRGGLQISAPDVSIMKPADVTLSTGAQAREWSLKAGHLSVKPGG